MFTAAFSRARCAAFRVPRIAGLLLVLCGTGCIHPSNIGDQSEATEPVSVTVVNNNLLDADVYVLRSGQRFRLGSVTTGATANYTLDRMQLAADGSLQLLATFVGASPSSRPAVTDRLFPQPGQNVEWTIENAIRQSGVMIRDV